MNSTFFFCFTITTLLITVAILSSSIRIVREDSRLSVYRLGRYLGEKGPGIVILIPIIDRGVIKFVGAAEITPSRRMAGVTGETVTTVYTQGKVFLAGEEWEAMSQSPISAGQRVRVVRMVLEVEKE